VSCCVLSRFVLHAVACCGVSLSQIIECSFDGGRKVWMFMRDRPDKDTANHRSVFDKVMTSIVDNITVRFRTDTSRRLAGLRQPRLAAPALLQNLCNIMV
jgi:hypothetical protein